MIRQGLGILGATSLFFLIVVACAEEIQDRPKKAPPTGGSSGTGSGGTGGNPTGGTGGGGVVARCEGACCPTDAKCYSTSAGNGSPGSECLATQDNTGTKRIQLRQQWIRATTPVGNTIDIVYLALSGRTQLPWPECKQSGAIGTGGYIQLIDVDQSDPDITKHYSYVGYAKYVPAADLQSTLSDGFCLGSEDYAGDSKYRLGQNGMSLSANYPEGLPAPMPLAVAPWKVTPAKAKRRAQDFNVATDREALLKEIAALAPQGFNGVFYYNDETGESHGYSPLSWTVVYGQDGAKHISIPIREAEVRYKFNDKDHPNCVGAYRASVPEPPACDPGFDQTKPAWGCLNDSCPAGESSATTDGYFLISELQQIYSEDLSSTLCVSYPGQKAIEAQGFYDATTKGCVTAKWDPTKPDQSGLPQGDWCAATNSAATATCHDAWRSHSFHVYAGAKIKRDVTCAF